MEKDMSQECTKIAEDGHKRAPTLTTHWSELSLRQSSKNDKENYQEHFSYTCRTSIFSLFFTAFYARYEKDHEPKSNRREKAAKGYVPRMHQDRRRLAQTCPDFRHPLEQAFIRQSNKNDKENCQDHLSSLVGPHFCMSFVFHTHWAKRPPAQVKQQRKSSQMDQHGRKTSDITAAKPST